MAGGAGRDASDDEPVTELSVDVDASSMAEITISRTSEDDVARARAAAEDEDVEPSEPNTLEPNLSVRELVALVASPRAMRRRQDTEADEDGEDLTARAIDPLFLEPHAGERGVEAIRSSDPDLGEPTMKRPALLVPGAAGRGDGEEEEDEEDETVTDAIGEVPGASASASAPAPAPAAASASAGTRSLPRLMRDSFDDDDSGVYAGGTVRMMFNESAVSALGKGGAPTPAAGEPPRGAPGLAFQAPMAQPVGGASPLPLPLPSPPPPGPTARAARFTPERVAAPLPRKSTRGGRVFAVFFFGTVAAIAMGLAVRRREMTRAAPAAPVAVESASASSSGSASASASGSPSASESAAASSAAASAAAAAASGAPRNVRRPRHH